MGKLKNLSIVALFKRFGQSIRRFPLAMLFTLAVSIPLGIIAALKHGK